MHIPDVNFRGIVDQMKEIVKALDKLTKAVQNTTTTQNTLNQTTPVLASAGTLLAEVPVHLDWATPGVNGKAYIVRNSDDRIVIDIEFDDESGDQTRLAEILPNMPLELLQISSMPA